MIQRNSPWNPQELIPSLHGYLTRGGTRLVEYLETSTFFILYYCLRRASGERPACWGVQFASYDISLGHITMTILAARLPLQSRLGCAGWDSGYLITIANLGCYDQIQITSLHRPSQAAGLLGERYACEGPPI